MDHLGHWEETEKYEQQNPIQLLQRDPSKQEFRPTFQPDPPMKRKIVKA